MTSLGNLISCNFTPFLSPPFTPQNPNPNFRSLSLRHNRSNSLTITTYSTQIPPLQRTILLRIRRSSVSEDAVGDEVAGAGDDDGEGEGGGGGEERDWTTSFLLFVFWGAVLYYAFNFAPNQTPSRDMYFLKKLLNLTGDDGFKMNQVLESLWYIMGLWPMVYAMLLLPTGRSSKSSIPVWPFLVLSFFGGAYALLPYFVLWKPPPPPVEEDELNKWPMNFLESKITAMVSCAAGLGLIVYAGLDVGEWTEFYQYFRESKFIHVTCIDFTLLSAFAPFWVYNDMTVRKCYDKLSWVLPLSAIPFLGSSLYILLRPPLPVLPSTETTANQE